MMICVMRGAVDDRLEKLGHSVISVMNGHCPHVDEYEEREVQQLVHGKHEHVDVIRDALQEAVDGVKRM